KSAQPLPPQKWLIKTTWFPAEVTSQRSFKKLFCISNKCVLLAGLPSIVTLKNGSFAEGASETETNFPPQEIVSAYDEIQISDSEAKKIILSKVRTPCFLANAVYNGSF